MDRPKIFGYIYGYDFKLIKSLKPFEQVHFLFKFMKIIHAVEQNQLDYGWYELILDTVSKNVYRMRDMQEITEGLDYLKANILKLIDVDVDFHDEMSVLTEPTAFGSGFMISTPAVIKKAIESKKDDASVASSVHATLERIEKRLDSIERLDLGARLSILESSFPKKPVDTPKQRDRSQYDSDTEDSEDS